MPRAVEFVETDALAPEHRAGAAALAYGAFADFYSLFSRDRERLLPAIAQQFGFPSELNHLVAAIEDGRLVGIAAHYELGEMQARQMEGARVLLAAADDARAATAALPAYGRNFPPPGDRGAYCSRFSIAGDKRGTGLAASLLERMESGIARRGWSPVKLHVRRDNARALAFYAKSGYGPEGPRDLGYMLLSKGAA